MATMKINAGELSSRKLWQLLNAPGDKPISQREQTEVVEELARRRRYLQQLRELGKLEVRVHY